MKSVSAGYNQNKGWYVIGFSTIFWWQGHRMECGTQYQRCENV